MPTPLIEKNAVLATANLLCSMGATQVYLFGSATKGGLRPDSDVDVAVRGLPPEVYFSDVCDGFSRSQFKWLAGGATLRRYEMM
jgi:predicted nucleotidyltransferase